MSNPLYHCGHCGSLFESELGHSEQRVCGVCLQKPGTGVWPASPEMAGAKADPVAGFGKSAEILEEGGQRAVRKKRRKNLVLRFVIAWTMFLGLAIWVRQYQTDRNRENEGKKQGQANMAEGTMADERVALLNSALPQCHQALAGFLTAGSPEARNQFVADPIATAGRMAVFYASNPFPVVALEQVKRVGQEPIKVGDEWMIETRWQVGESGAQFDAVFRRSNGVWMLDWEHFARYSEHPWALFLAGEGANEAEFRLLAREVSSGDEAEQGGSRLRFVLLAPEFGKPLASGVASPEIVMGRSSDEGRLLEAAFAASREGRQVFGSSMKSMEPEGMARVRVVVKRGEFGGERSFEVTKISACHWINSDEVGFDLEQLKDDLFGEN